MKTIVYTLALLLASATFASAAQVDADAFAFQLREQLQKEAGVVLEWSSVSSDNFSKVVFKGSSLKSLGGSRVVPLNGDATFSGVDGTAETGWSVGAFSFADFTIPGAEGAVSISVKGLAGQGFYLGAGNQGITLAVPHRISTDSVAMTLAGKDIVSFDEVSVSTGPNGTAMIRDLSAIVTVQSDVWRGLDATAALPAYLSSLGYGMLKSDVSLRTTHDPSAATFRALLQIDSDAAYLKLSSLLLGATPPVARTIVAAFGFADAPPSQTDMLAAVSTLEWKDASVLYEDRGFVGRIAARRSETSAAEVEALKERVLTAVDIAPLDAASKDGFRKGIDQAFAGTGGISLEAHPATAVSLARIGSLIMTNPGQLPSVIGLTASPVASPKPAVPSR